MTLTEMKQRWSEMDRDEKRKALLWGTAQPSAKDKRTTLTIGFIAVALWIPPLLSHLW